MTGCKSELYTPSVASILINRDGWASVLKLSTLWTFQELRLKAVNALSANSGDPVDKVILARDYKVENLGYYELVKRDAGMSPEDRRRLGYETACKLYVLRERIFKSHVGKTWHVVLSGLEKDIRRIFLEELADVREEIQL
jgi:hypothetical protein